MECYWLTPYLYQWRYCWNGLHAHRMNVDIARRLTRNSQMVHSCRKHWTMKLIREKERRTVGVVLLLLCRLGRCALRRSVGKGICEKPRRKDLGKWETKRKRKAMKRTDQQCWNQQSTTDLWFWIECGQAAFLYVKLDKSTLSRRATR